MIRKLLCNIGIHKYKEENFPVTKNEYGAYLALPCDVCANCGRMRKGHKSYLAQMRGQAGLTSRDFKAEIIDPLIFSIKRKG